MITLAEKMRMAAGYQPKPDSWIATLAGESTSSQQGRGVAVLSDGSVATVAYVGLTDSTIALISSSGALQWQRNLNAGIHAVFVDGTDDIYVIGYKSSQAHIAKYNSSGSLQWQRKLYSADTVNCFHGFVGGGDVYLCCNEWDGSSNSVFIAKYNSSGTLQWQQSISSATQIYSGRGFVVSGGNVFVVGYDAGSPDKSYIIELDPSTGAEIDQRSISSAYDMKASDIVVDSSVAYIAHEGNGGNGFATAVNTSTWAAVFGRRYSTDSLICAHKLPSGNFAFGAGNGELFALQSDADMSFERSITGTGGGYLWDIDDDGINMFLSGRANRTSTGNDAMVAKLPQDGSALGAYGWITYADGSDGLSSLSITVAASSLTIGSGSLTEAAGSMTDSSGTLTYELLTL